MTISIAKALLEATQILRKAGVPESRREAGSLLEYAIEKDRTFLFREAEYHLTKEETETFRTVVSRRAAGEPLQYITNRQDFYGREFRVTPDVLIPRPETELLVESALELMGDMQSQSLVCDVGTGSGCIVITLLCEHPGSRAVALDISNEALSIAKLNSNDQGVADRIEFLLSDCFESLVDKRPTFDLIVSNPPYVPETAVGGLQREVKDHEPMVALSPGGDGLSIIRRLISEAPTFLRETGFLLLEIGFDQGEAVRQLVDPRVWRLIDIRPDLQGIPRIVLMQKTPNET